MRSPVVSGSIAAVLIIAALVGTHLFTGTSNVAWGAVLDRVKGIDNYVYRIREIETTGPRPDGFEFATEGQTTVYHSADFGDLEERSYAGVESFSKYYWLRQTNECIGICYPLERYERASLSQGWTRDSRDPRQMIVRSLESNHVSLGRDKIAGRSVEGVRTRQAAAFAPHLPSALDEFSASVWTDVETELPVWVEISYVEKGSTLHNTVVLDQFQWGVALDASLFEPSIPEGYALRNGDETKVRVVSDSDSVHRFDLSIETEPYLGEFDDLPLPDLSDVALLGVAVDEANRPRRLTTNDDVWMAQDRFVSQWPPFDTVRAELHQELQARFGIDRSALNDLMALGIALRERFWESGGCLSSISYPYAYAARIVIEMAHRQAPNDSAVTDQLIESITSYELMWVHDPAPDKRVPNPTYTGLLTQLRLEQFDRIKQAVANGYVPTWRDFVRIEDLAFLLNARRKDLAGGLEVTRWLIDQAETAGWIACLDSLTRMEETLVSGDTFVPGVFMNPESVYPEDYRYGRRLCSFQGPRWMRARLIPFHQRARR